MNQNTVSSTSISFVGFGGFTALVALLSKESEQPVAPTVVALDAPRVYGARPATAVEAKASSAGPKPAKTTKPTATSSARNPGFGVEDVVRIRRSVARREFDHGMPATDAKVFGSRFVLKIVLAEHGENPSYKHMLTEIRKGLEELLGKDDGRDCYLALKTTIKAELAAKTTTPVVARPAPRPAPVAPKAPVVELEPKYDEQEIKLLVGAAELVQLDVVAQNIVGLLKGDGRYTGAERNELMAYTRDMVVGRAMALGHSLRDAETTADATLGALPRKPRAVALGFKPANVETLSVKTNAAPKPVVVAKTLFSKEELADLVSPVVEVSQETPKAKRERDSRDIRSLAELVAADQQREAERITKREAEKAARAATQAAKEAKAKLMASDLKAGAQPPRAPKPPKAEKGGKKGRKGKQGQHAEARA